MNQLKSQRITAHGLSGTYQAQNCLLTLVWDERGKKAKISWWNPRKIRFRRISCKSDRPIYLLHRALFCCYCELWWQPHMIHAPPLKSVPALSAVMFRPPSPPPKITTQSRQVFSCLSAEHGAKGGHSYLKIHRRWEWRKWREIADMECSLKGSSFRSRSSRWPLRLYLPGLAEEIGMGFYLWGWRK